MCNRRRLLAFILWIVSIGLLSACTIKETNIRVIVPLGSPSLSVLGLDEDHYTIDIVNGPDPLVAAFGSGSHEAIIAPTNLGAKFYQSNDEYRLLAVIGLGNYHLVSTSLINQSLDQLNQREILVFGQNQTSDIIVKHLLEQANIDANIAYTDSLASAATMFLLDPSKIVLVAEPSLSLIKAQVPDVISIDLDDIYRSLHEGLSFPQASLFVKKSLSEQQRLKLIDDMTTSIHFLLEDPEEAARKGVDLGILDDGQILTQAIPGSHIDLITSSEAKPMIEAYFQLILAMNPALIGGAIPNDDFYME